MSDLLSSLPIYDNAQVLGVMMVSILAARHQAFKKRDTKKMKLEEEVEKELRSRYNVELALTPVFQAVFEVLMS